MDPEPTPRATTSHSARVFEMGRAHASARTTGGAQMVENSRAVAAPDDEADREDEAQEAVDDDEADREEESEEAAADETSQEEEARKAAVEAA